MSDLTYRWEPSTQDKAGLQVRQLVQAVATLRDGDDVTITRSTAWGSTYQDVEPLAGLRAAKFTQHVARGLVRQYATAARAGGASWATVGAALGIGDIAQRTGRDLAEAAWFLVVDGIEPTEDRSFSSWSETLGWTCSTCARRVQDHGPFDSHPQDCEPGHAESCTRQATAVADWRRRCDWDVDELDEETAASADHGGDTGGVPGRW